MLDIGWSELMLIAVVALVVIGPKDLPQAIYALGKWVRKARLVAREFQGHLDDMMREAEVAELKKQALSTADFDLRREVEKAIDPEGDLKKAFDLPPEATGAAGHAGSPPEEPAPAPAIAPAAAPAEASTEPAPPAIEAPAGDAVPAAAVPAADKAATEKNA